MNQPDPRLIIALWFAIALFILSAAAFFYLSSAGAKLKQRVFHWYTAIGGALVLLWFWLLGGWPALALGIPFFAIAALISLKTTRFCPVCGRTMMNQFLRAKFCPRCGADLDQG